MSDNGGSGGYGTPDAATLTRWATAYLARYAASTHRLRLVLLRRARRRCAKQDLPMPDDLEQMVTDIVTRLVGQGFVDDHAFALGRARALTRKGWPRGRIRSALGAEGLDFRADDVEQVMGDDEAAQARRFTERRRLGPYRMRDRIPSRDKDIRTLMRAGFSFRIATAAIDADPE